MIWTVVVAFLLGAVGWSLAEYVLHRFLMHVPRGRGLASREHLTHHAKRDYFTTGGQKAVTAAAVTAVVFPVLAIVGSLEIAIAATVGLNAAYFAYEVIHRRAHTHGPTNAYGVWLRRNHFAHHFSSPNQNFGVTSPVWDIVFGTHKSVESLRVPKRWAMSWLTDETGAVRPELSGSYRLSGRSSKPCVDDDTRDAVANVAPHF